MTKIKNVKNVYIYGDKLMTDDLPPKLTTPATVYVQLRNFPEFVTKFQRKLPLFSRYLNYLTAQC